MSTATVATLFDLDFMHQNRNLMSLPGSNSNQNRLNSARQINFQGSPFVPHSKSSPLPRPAQIDMCFPPMQKTVGHSLPTQSPSVIAPPSYPLQRRDSVKSDSSQGSTVGESTRYKTELCRPFEETGHCRYGSKCQFAHGSQELRNLNRHPKYKTELCRTFHTTGFCSYGQRCNFIHNDEERRMPSQNDRNQNRAQRPRALILSPTIAGSTSESPCSSISGDSPSQSPGFLNEDVFASLRLSPTPSFGSDCSSTSFPSPPGTPSHSNYEQNIMTSPLDLGLNLPVFNRTNL